MNFFPAEDIVYKTKLKETEIVKRLSENIEPEKKFRIGLFENSATKPYEGFIKDQAFNISRIINYRNSFIPRITGNIVHEYDGTKVKVKMRLDGFIVVFLCIWFGGIGMAGVALLTNSIRNNEFSPVTFIPWGMLTFGYILTTMGFKFECNKSKIFLQHLFEAEIMQK